MGILKDITDKLGFTRPDPLAGFEYTIPYGQSVSAVGKAWETQGFIPENLSDRAKFALSEHGIDVVYAMQKDEFGINIFTSEKTAFSLNQEFIDGLKDPKHPRHESLLSLLEKHTDRETLHKILANQNHQSEPAPKI